MIIKTILEGMLGGLTFGIYHHYVSMREIEKFNKKWETELEAKFRQRK